MEQSIKNTIGAASLPSPPPGLPRTLTGSSDSTSPGISRDASNSTSTRSSSVACLFPPEDTVVASSPIGNGATVVNRAGGEVVAGGTASAVAMAGGANQPPMLPFSPRTAEDTAATKAEAEAVRHLSRQGGGGSSVSGSSSVSSHSTRRSTNASPSAPTAGGGGGGPATTVVASPFAGGAVDGDTQGGPSSKNSSKSNGSISTTSSNRGLATTAASNEEDLTSTTDGARTGATVVDNRAGGEVVAGGTASAVAMAGGASRPPMLPFRPRAVNSLGNTQGSPSAVPNGASFVDERQRLQRRLRAFESKLWDTQRRLLAVDLESKEYRDEVLRLREFEAENPRLRNEASDLNRSIQNLEHQLDDLNGQLEAAGADPQIYNLFEESEGQHSRVLKNRPTQTETYLEDLERERDDLVRRVARLRRERDDLKRTLDQLRVSNQSLEKALNEQRALATTARTSSPITLLPRVVPRSPSVEGNSHQICQMADQSPPFQKNVTSSTPRVVEDAAEATKAEAGGGDVTSSVRPTSSQKTSTANETVDGGKDETAVTEKKAPTKLKTSHGPGSSSVRLLTGTPSPVQTTTDEEEAAAGKTAEEDADATESVTPRASASTKKKTKFRLSTTFNMLARVLLRVPTGAALLLGIEFCCAKASYMSASAPTAGGAQVAKNSNNGSNPKSDDDDALPFAGGAVDKVVNTQRGPSGKSDTKMTTTTTTREMDDVQVNGLPDEVRPGPQSRQPTTPNGARRGGGSPEQGNHERGATAAPVVGRVGGAGGGRADEEKVDLVGVAREASASPMQEGRATAPESAVGAAGVGGAPAVAEGKKGTQGDEGDSVLVSPPRVSPPTSGNAGSSAASVSE